MPKLTKKEMKDNLDDPHWWDENIWGPAEDWFEEEEKLSKCSSCGHGDMPEWEDQQVNIAQLVRNALFGKPKRVIQRVMTTTVKHPYLERCDMTGEVAGCNHEDCT